MAIISAEFGAVLLSIRYLHLIYEDYLREEYQMEFAKSIRQVLKDEFRNTENSRVFIEEARKIFIEAGNRDLESYLSFQRIGIKAIYERLSTDEVGKRLKRAKKIDVMKTWFPDHPDIEAGLREAMRKPDVEVRLLLSHPDSPLLRQRSIGAGHDRDPEHGSRQVEQTLLNIYNWASDGAPGKFEIGLYQDWPGCPIIWYGEDILRHALLGFYLRGKSSPFWPWIEIEAKSNLDNILRQQFDDLWKKTPKITNSEELVLWLKNRGVLKDEKQSEQDISSPDITNNS